MEKKDLKNLMIVELRNGNKYVVVEDLLIGINGYDALSYYDESLINESEKEYDIVKVYDVCKSWGVGFKKSIEFKDIHKLIWERPKELLTEEEKEYLKAVAKPFKDKIDFIRAFQENIEIKLKGDYGDYNIWLPTHNDLPFNFEHLEFYKKYTLKELGLED